jgi:hypothetical protein
MRNSKKKKNTEKIQLFSLETFEVKTPISLKTANAEMTMISKIEI